MEYSIDHYEAIKAGVIDGSLKPTLKPVKAALVSLNIKFVDDASRQKKASNILAQLLKEGVIIDNPEFGSTGKVVAKYILNPDAKLRDNEELKSEEFAMTCQCSECGKLEEVRATNAAGKVRSVCGAVYIASDNQVKREVIPAAGVGVSICQE